MVVVTGPESSGTRLLAGIVRDVLGVEAWHHSMPHGDAGPNGDGWWLPEEFPDARFVIIVRRPDVTGPSAVFHSHVPTLAQHREEWQRAISVLASIPDAYWMSYEALVANPVVQISSLAHWLGTTLDPEKLPEITDRNDRWLRLLGIV